MATEHIAIIISVFSVGVASVSLGWNIYRDIVLKAKVRVDFGVRILQHSSMPDSPKFVSIVATNYGPGPVNLNMILARYSPLWKRLLRKSEYAIITADYTNPTSAHLPAKVEAGDEITLLLPYNKDCLLNRDWTHVGLNDVYRRRHWAARKQIETARQEWIKDFGSET